MTIQLNENYMMDFLNQLLNTPSPSGYTHHVMELIRKEAESPGYKSNGMQKAVPS